MPIGGASPLLVAVNQRGFKLTVCHNVISKKVRPISHVCPAENGVKVLALPGMDVSLAR